MTLIETMEAYAKEHDVPIMQPEGMEFLCTFLKEHTDIHDVLEIGTAIGYSAIRMAMVRDDLHITTIERDEERYQKALVYTAQSDAGKRIRLIFGDALETVLAGSFDLLFIDAAKAQYIRFFERYEGLLRQGGYIISDNLFFHGLVGQEETIKNRNLRSLVRKLHRFHTYLAQRTDYETEILSIGDGIAISRKR